MSQQIESQQIPPILHPSMFTNSIIFNDKSDTTSISTTSNSTNSIPIVTSLPSIPSLPAFDANLMPQLVFGLKNENENVKIPKNGNMTDQIIDNKLLLKQEMDIDDVTTEDIPPALDIGGYPPISRSRSDTCLDTSSCSDTSKSYNGNHEYNYFKCLLCNQSFNDELIFISHSRQCSSNYKQTLKKSKNKKTKITTKKKFACNKCSKSFQQVNALIIHIRVHTGDKPFKCDYCPKSFRQNCHLIRHKRLHTGEKPYKCDYCSKRFSSSTRKNRHHRKQHNIHNTHSQNT